MTAFLQQMELTGGRRLGAGAACFLVAELSGNHNGKLERALDLVRAAREAGADAVKLQTYTADTLTIDSEQPWFRIAGDNAWKGRTLYDLYQEASTPWEWHPEIFRCARELGLEVFSTPFDQTAIDYLERFQPALHKIASFELVDLELVEAVGRTGRPTIMSTGMASEQEIEEAVQAFASTGNRQLVLLKCTSAYPAPASEMNLRAMTQLQQRFQVPVGLSDHCLHEWAAIAAVSLGACVIEKHLTLSRQDGGVDSSFSLEPGEFRRMVQAVRETEAVLGNGSLGAGGTERENVVFRRSIFAVRDIARGETFTRENVRVIRPGHGLSPKFLRQVLGRSSPRDVKRGEPITAELLEGPRA